MLIARGGRTVLVADTNVIDMPSAEELADIAVQSAATAARSAMNPALPCLLIRLSGT